LKVLLITGLLAEKIVKKYAQESAVETEVLALASPVAALLSPKKIAKALHKKSPRGFELILVPGLIRGDTSVIADSTGIPTFKGPRYAADLPTVLDVIDQAKLSTEIPACELLREVIQQRALQELHSVERMRDVLLKKPGNMLIGDLAIGKDFPMRVMAEIVDAALMSNDEIQRLANYYSKMGADIIDVGMVAGESRPADVKRAVEAVKSVVALPVSIDTVDPVEIREAVLAGVDLILSVDAGNIEKIAPFASDVAAVVIPTNQFAGYFPVEPEQRVCFLEANLERAKKLGMKRLLGDLILEPSNLSDSIVAFRDFASRNSNVPLFVGVSNVTELFDADSVGINALLARLASEVNASILLATEKSNKAKGTVREEVLASKMMFLSKKRGSVPKDLGIDLLILKDKRNREEAYDRGMEADVQVVTSKNELDLVALDPQGVFKIVLDRNEDNIIVLHFATADSDKPNLIAKGKTAKAVFDKILEMGLVTELEHAAYMGRELAKAEIALRIGKAYIQDLTLFNWQQPK